MIQYEARNTVTTNAFKGNGMNNLNEEYLGHSMNK